jgi:XTP/dITP diphosphohydrolase
MLIHFASANAHKIEELRAMLPSGFELQGLRDLAINVDIPETGKTISENSRIKAQFLFNHLGANGKNGVVIADDSGLEVPALGGDPGVRSARFAGELKSDKANNEKLLREMSFKNNRQARFVTVITLIHQGKEFVFEGEVKGTIAQESRGKTGFGYDPLFIPQGYRSTFSELGPQVKNQISHRAMAVNKLLEFLKKL